MNKRKRKELNEKKGGEENEKGTLKIESQNRKSKTSPLDCFFDIENRNRKDTCNPKADSIEIIKKSKIENRKGDSPAFDYLIFLNNFPQKRIPASAYYLKNKIMRRTDRLRLTIIRLS